MSQYALIDADGRVINIILADEAFVSGPAALELAQAQGGSEWVLTPSVIPDQNNPEAVQPLRTSYAAIGGIYIRELAVFVPPRPFPSWTLDTQLGRWQAPVPKPDSDVPLIWDESQLNWVVVTRPLPPQ
jgi:hypothetical protein